jgi:hypothetical protein
MNACGNRPPIAIKSRWKEPIAQINPKIPARIYPSFHSHVLYWTDIFRQGQMDQY